MGKFRHWPAGRAGGIKGKVGGGDSVSLGNWNGPNRSTAEKKSGKIVV